MTEEEYIRDRLIAQQKWYSKESTKNKKRFQRLKIIEIVLAAMIPFLSGFSALCWYDNCLNKDVIIGIFGIIITVAAGILMLFSNQEKWIEYRTTSEQLKSEKIRFETKTGVYKAAKNPFDLLVDRVELIISDENAKWREIINNEEG